ncbi:MAG: hypothetical protein JSV86_01100 [Gemmatimonadota bacterium]|nr:MAG: hypothetical protein JSV86_01100 [Gemmatimonadota bacterium]
MDYLLRIPVALIGLLLVRGFLYPSGWRRRSLVSALWALIGIALTFPLATHSSVGLIITGIAASTLLFPYRVLAVRYMKTRTRSGLRQLARRWGTRLQEDPRTGRWQVVRELDGRKSWVGNVLTHKGSIDPAVRRKEVGFMLAFVRELDREPPFLCSLMIGWEKPRYFEREWRATHVIHGEFLSLPFGDVGLADDRGRATGGVASRLEPLVALPADLERKVAAIGANPDAFARVFTAETLERFFQVATRTYPYELNVTPSSVNIYTTYCDAEAQLANLGFLEHLVAKLKADR